MDEITLQLPSGEALKIAPDDARVLAQRLWDIASHPGAAPIAVKLGEAVWVSAFLRSPIEVSEREYGALRQVLAYQAPN
jgi:hypothetical protein